MIIYTLWTNSEDIMKDILEKIKEFADRSHGDQLRKYTFDRYIVHPVRVMEILENYTMDLPVLAAALLHDVLEDTPVTKQNLQEYLHTIMTPTQTTKTVTLVVELTDVFTHQNFPELNRKARKQKELERLRSISPESQTIKYADILDNSIDISKHDKHFSPVYLNEVFLVLSELKSGNPHLRHRVINTVGEILKSVRNK